VTPFSFFAKYISGQTARLSQDPGVQEQLLLRIGLVGAGSLLLYVSLDVFTGPVIESPTLIAILAIAGGLGLLLMMMAGLRRPPAVMRWVILSAFILDVFVHAFIWIQSNGTVTGRRLPYFIEVDAAFNTDVAARLVQRGDNPYTWDYSGVFDLHRTSPISSTPTLSGALEHRYGYPALQFLFAVPLQRLGLPGTWSLLILAHLLMLIILFVGAPHAIQPLILLPIGLATNFTLLTLIGSLDMVWSVCLVVMILRWRSPMWRALFYGLAIALKQGPWLVAPFLVIRVWRDDEEEGPALLRAARFVALSSLVAFVINVPYIVWDFGAWLRGVAEPLLDPLAFLSQGSLANLTQFGILYLPKSYYTIATLLVFALLLFCYWRHYAALRDTLWVLPGIFMWFSYRTLVSYWVYWLFPVLATLATARAPLVKFPRLSLRLTLSMMAGSCAALLVLGIFMASPVAVVGLTIRSPIFMEGGRLSELSVEVKNNSDHSLAPRFAVQSSRTVANPIVWAIKDGPLSLIPGQSAVYQIVAVDLVNSTLAHEAGQLVVTDANGDYALRGVVTIAADRSFLWPDAIPNPTYRYWNETRTAPIFWGTNFSRPDAGTIAMARKAGRDALVLTLTSSNEVGRNVAVYTPIIFPAKPFGVWLYQETDKLPYTYGLEIRDGQRSIVYSWGEQNYLLSLNSNQYVIQRSIEPGQWRYQTIDLQAAYAQAGWAAPVLKRERFRYMDIDLSLVTFSWFVYADKPTQTYQAFFGPIEQESLGVAPEKLMDETFSQPAAYYVRLGDFYNQERNYAKALEAYRQALVFAPDDITAKTRLEQVTQHMATRNSG
jgi:uncharacterized membrane protein